MPMNTEKRVKITAVSPCCIRAEETQTPHHRHTFERRAEHLYLPRVGDFCMIEETPKGWRILRRTLAP